MGPVTAETLYLNQKVSDLIRTRRWNKAIIAVGDNRMCFSAVQAVFRDEGGCVRLQHHRLDRIEPCVARVVALDSTAATGSAKDVKFRPSRAKSRDPEKVSCTGYATGSLDFARDDKMSGACNIVAWQQNPN